MELRENQKKLAADHRNAKYKFILTELDLALTFCEMAITTKNEAKLKRNTKNARLAYNAATHFMEHAGFSERMETHVQEKLGRLRTMLKQLNGRCSILLRAL